MEKIKTMKTKFYLTENGNILNTEKGCFQTAGGQFLRRVFDADYKKGTVSIVCNETGETVFETEVI